MPVYSKFRGMNREYSRLHQGSLASLAHLFQFSAKYRGSPIPTHLKIISVAKMLVKIWFSRPRVNFVSGSVIAAGLSIARTTVLPIIIAKMKPSKIGWWTSCAERSEARL